MASLVSSEHSLLERLANSLPLHSPFTFYHISTPPTRVPAIHSAPPGAKPETTFLESHFLTASIRPGDRHHTTGEEILVLAIEILIYTTKHLTTIFVSKADSTGYLGLAKIAKGAESPLRTIASTFLGYLVEKRTRDARRLVVSLFARANDQYLFPGSVENTGKHVSDDRQLIKWWCRVLDPILREYKSEDEIEIGEDKDGADAVSSQAYLIVPGEEGILGFLPQAVRLQPTLRKRWTHGHPLRHTARYPAAPPRCLIPHYPDDPKSRFLDELDDELPETNSSNDTTSSPSKRGNGQWRSVRSLEQFWEMMAFRQECSSGRLVGFVWVVFSPHHIEAPDPYDASQHGQSTEVSNDSGESQEGNPSSTQRKSQRSQPIRKRITLRGPIISRAPRIKSPPNTSLSKSLPERTKYFFWPENSRGEILFSEKDYRKATEVLLRLDFASRDVAGKSTRTWVDELGVLSGAGSSWGRTVTGRKIAPALLHTNGTTSSAATTILSAKRKSDTLEQPAPAINGYGDSVNNLSAGLIKKKPKKIQPELPSSEIVTPVRISETQVVATHEKPALDDRVQLLGAGVVREKPKTT